MLTAILFSEFQSAVSSMICLQATMERVGKVCKATNAQILLTLLDFQTNWFQQMQTDEIKFDPLLLGRRVTETTRH